MRFCGIVFNNYFIISQQREKAILSEWEKKNQRFFRMEVVENPGVN